MVRRGGCGSLLVHLVDAASCPGTTGQSLLSLGLPTWRAAAPSQSLALVHGYIRMPVDEHSRMIIPKNLVTGTSIVERRHVWAALIPNMDGVTRACVLGKHSYPRDSWRTVASWKPNHKPSEDEEAKRALGPKIAECSSQAPLSGCPQTSPPPRSSSSLRALCPRRVMIHFATSLTHEWAASASRNGAFTTSRLDISGMGFHRAQSLSAMTWKRLTTSLAITLRAALAISCGAWDCWSEAHLPRRPRIRIPGSEDEEVSVRPPRHPPEAAKS